MAYIGKSIESGTFSVLDTSGNTYNGSNTTFNLGTQVGSVAQLLVSHDGVLQKPGTDYTLASGGTQITFTTAPASGASIFIVEISGAVGGPLDADLNGTELILDADGDTSLHASTDDQIDIKIAGADDFQFTANTFTAASGSTIAAQALTATTLTATGAVSLNGGSFVFNEDSADVDFRVEGNGDTHAIFMNGELDHVNFGSSDASLYQVDIKDATAFDPSNNTANSAPLRVRSSATTGNLGAIAIGGNNNNGIFNSGNNEIALQGYNIIRFFCSNTNDDKFGTKTERMRIDSSGNIMVAKTSLALGTAGTEIEVGGTGVFTASGNHLLNLNRLASDGDIARIYQATNQEGSISVSGTTVAYNTFCGAHWSRLADNSKPTILRGTVMETITTMIDWYQAVADVAESTDLDGNVIPAHQVKESIALPNGKSVGDAVTFKSKGKDYTGKYVKEDNEQLPMCKISDTADSKSVYGVFMAWDDSDDGLDGDVNDMHVASLGAFVVRVHKDQTVAIGDYLVSNGDGTAKKQADDILRASTIAKVTSTEKTITHADGSYCVPCTLHCG